MAGLGDAPAAGWSRLHHGIDPRGNRLLWWWLQGMWRIAWPLARVGLLPIAVTVAGALLAVAAALRDWPWVALVLVLASVVCDGVDGAVALLEGVASRAGAAADKAADRIADVAFVVVLWRCGAPPVLVWLTGAAVLGVEGWREFVGGAARSTITVAERPSRVVCVVVACVAAGVSDTTWPATVSASILFGLSVIALAQLHHSTRLRHVS